MAMIYKERGVKLRDAELEISNQKMSIDAKDAYIEEIRLNMITALDNLQTEKDAEIERLKGYNHEAIKQIKSHRELYNELKWMILKDDYSDYKSVSHEHTLKVISQEKELLGNSEASYDHAENLHQHWKNKYNRLVSCVKRCDETGMSVCDILSIHRENEANLKEQRKVTV